MTVVTMSIPIEADADGVMRVSRTRVTLDTLIAAFKEGATAEEITQQYPTVPLADVYSVIGYFLQHQPEVEAYLSLRQVQAEQVRQENETRFNAIDVRERLLARKINKR